MPFGVAMQPASSRHFWLALILINGAILKPFALNCRKRIRLGLTQCSGKGTYPCFRTYDQKDTQYNIRQASTEVRLIPLPAFGDMQDAVHAVLYVSLDDWSVGLWLWWGWGSPTILGLFVWKCIQLCRDCKARGPLPVMISSCYVSFGRFYLKVHWIVKRLQSYGLTVLRKLPSLLSSYVSYLVMESKV